MEKALKAIVVKTTRDHPPRIHNLIRLKELARLELISDFEDILSEFNLYNLHGRYPDFPEAHIAKELADIDYKRGKEVFKWLSMILQK